MSTDVLMEKWAPVINHEDLDPIKERDRKAVVAQVLENTEKALREEAGMLDESSLSGAGFGGGFSGAGSNATINATGRAGYDPIIISLVRRAMPQMMAFDLCGVQPMSAPTGLIFALRARYQDSNTSTDGREAFYNEVFPNFSGTPFNTGSPATHAAGSNDATATNPFTPGRANNSGDAGSDGGSAADNFTANFVNDPFATGTPVALESADIAGGNPETGDFMPASMTAAGQSKFGMSTREGEGDNFREMSFTIERTSVEAKTRALKSEYTVACAAPSSLSCSRRRFFTLPKRR